MTRLSPEQAASRNSQLDFPPTVAGSKAHDHILLPFLHPVPRLDVFLLHSIRSGG